MANEQVEPVDPLKCILQAPVVGALGYVGGYVNGWINTAIFAGRNVYVFGTIVPKALNLAPITALTLAIQAFTATFLSAFMPPPQAQLIGFIAGFWGAAEITHFSGGAWALFLINVKICIVVFAVLGAVAVEFGIVGGVGYMLAR